MSRYLSFVLMFLAQIATAGAQDSASQLAATVR